MAFKIEGKEMLTIEKYTPSLFSQSVVGQFTTLCGKAWQACAQQTEKSHSHTNSAASRQVYVAYMLCWFSIHIVNFFNIWFGMAHHQKQFECREGKKLVKIYRFYRAEE